MAAEGRAPEPDALALRRLALAVAVLHDVDLRPRDDGVLLPGADLHVPWQELVGAVGGADLDGPLARSRALRHLRGRGALAGRDPRELAARARPVGLPVGHPRDPGPAWVCLRVPGAQLVAGVGFLGLGADPGRVVLVPVSASAAAGLEPGLGWASAQEHLERLGALAGARARVVRDGVLRPSGEADVVTLLASVGYRAVLAGLDGTGMCAVAVPSRERGWTGERHLDPAFVAAAAAATDDAERGFPHPLLVTEDEVTHPTGPR